MEPVFRVGEGVFPVAFLMGLVFLIPLLIAWAMIWKGWALWIAARQGSKPWFIVLLLINTVGILEILYIFYFSKKKHSVMPVDDNNTKPASL